MPFFGSNQEVIGQMEQTIIRVRLRLFLNITHDHDL